MIRATLLVAGLGLLVLAGAFVTGYRVVEQEDVPRHLAIGLLGSATMLFANLCVLIYLPLTRRLVRRTTSELGLGPEWLATQNRLARRATWPAAVAALLVVATFGAGFPTYTASWTPLAHHLLALAAALAELVFLRLAGRALAAGERHLRALDREVEGVYTPRLESAPAAASPPRQP